MSRFESEDQARYLVEIVDQVMSELVHRAPAFEHLGERDQVAISTAVGKAAWRGLLRGSVTVHEQANEVWARDFLPRLRASLPAATLPDELLSMSFLDPETGQEPAGSDSWAELYGPDGDN